MLDDLRTTTPPDAEAAKRRAWTVTAEAFAERHRATETHRAAATDPRRAADTDARRAADERRAADTDERGAADTDATRRGRRRVGRLPAPRRLRPAALVAAVAALAALVGVAAFTPPGEAVADFVQRVVDPPPREPAERPVSVPGPGRILVAGDDGLRIVGRSGAGRSLGEWSGATWSPNARFIAAWRGRELAALAPDGRRPWTLRTPAPVAAARWSPEGFHVAYLVRRSSGADVRVVAGNGLRDRLWRAGVTFVTPAFRANARRTLAWVRADGRIPVADVFTGQVGALSGPRLGGGATHLAWTGDGRRLAVLAVDEVRIWNVARGSVRTIPLAGTGSGIAASPRGTRVAVLTNDHRRDVSTVTLLPSGRTIRVRGLLRDLTFSPDGRTVVAAWPTRRRWLVLDAREATLDATPTPRGFAGRITSWSR